MQWSKLRQLLENNLSPSLKGRVQLHSTRYRGTHDEEGRAWITVDKKDIFSMCTVNWLWKHYHLEKEIEVANNGEQPDPGVGNRYFFMDDSSQQTLRKQGIYSQYEFYEAANTFIGLPIHDALQSENILIRALAILDKRVGKRTLSRLCDFGIADPLLRFLYHLRCDAEGIKIKKLGVTTGST
jgi:hypothetical protein